MGTHRKTTAAAAWLLAALLGAGAARAADLSVRVIDAPREGTLVLEVYDAPNAFGDLRDPIRREPFELDGREVFVVRDLPPGAYAVLAWFDENGNGVLDKNFIGVPTEPIAFSRRYQPKGPPSFSRAQFGLAEGVPTGIEAELYRALGRRGRLGVGVGVIGRSSPYKGDGGAVYQVIPALSYNGERLQVFGPGLRFGLAGTGDLRLAAQASYRIGVYEEDDSPALEGLGDRKDTAMAGLALEWELPGGFDLSASYEHDVLDEIGGGAVAASIGKGFQLGVARLGPAVGATLLSSELSNHDFGVPADKARPDRPAYRLDETFSVEAGLGVFVEITSDVLLFGNAAIEWLGDEVTDSPIVEDDYVLKGFAALAYVF